MNNNIKNRKLINASEIARQIGVSPGYVRLLLAGKRKSSKRLNQIKKILIKGLE